MSSDNHMTDICEMVVKVIRETPILQERGMEAKLWGHVFSTTNPHCMIDPWSFYRQLPPLIGDFVAMWGGPRVDVVLADYLPTPEPIAEDIFGLIIQGRDAAPAMFKDQEMEPRLFAYCLNVCRPHSEAHGRTMHHSAPQVIQEFVESWGVVFGLICDAEKAEPKQLPPGLVELPDSGIINVVKPTYGGIAPVGTEEASKQRMIEVELDPKSNKDFILPQVKPVEQPKPPAATGKRKR